MVSNTKGNKEYFKIFFTSVGRRVELVQAFRDASTKLGINLKIYGGDYTYVAPALYFCDERIKLCKIDSENYLSQLVEICNKERIDLLIPTIDTDLLILAQNKNKFELMGTRVLVSEEQKILICMDKKLTEEFFTSCDLKSPYVLDNVNKFEAKFPCFIKPRNGSSSIDAYKINNEKELFIYSKKINDYIIQPYIEGEEYTIDICCDFHGNPIYIVPRKRISVRGGEVLQTQICLDKKIIEECSRLIEKFKPYGPITIQLINEKCSEENYYIEINPRFGGGSPLSMKAGADSALIIIKLLMGKEDHNDLDIKEIEDGLFYCRFDQSICINKSFRDEKNEIKAVIFDLDDTLYSEKDYIKSGYNFVASKIPNINGFEEKLWNAFLIGEKAFDFVLNSEGLYTKELKNKCIELYRYHNPNISLYAGIKEMLIYLREKGIKIGIITDGESVRQNKKIDSLGIRDLIDEIIITDDIGGMQFRKPNDLAFRIMKDKLSINGFEVNYKNMIYVGDNLIKDFIAPQKLGMRSLYFKNGEGLYNNNVINNTICIVRSIDEMKNYIVNS